MVFNSVPILCWFLVWASKSHDRLLWETLLWLAGAVPPGGAQIYSYLPHLRRLNSLRLEHSLILSLCFASYGRPWSHSRASCVTGNENCSHELWWVSVGMVWPCFIPWQGRYSVLLNVRDTNQRQVVTWIYFPFGRSLDFSLLSRSMFNNHVCNELLQKLLELQFPGKKRRGCFSWGRLAYTDISRISVPLPAFCSPFLLLYLRFGLTLEWSG